MEEDLVAWEAGSLVGVEVVGDPNLVEEVSRSQEEPFQEVGASRSLVEVAFPLENLFRVVAWVACLLVEEAWVALDETLEDQGGEVASLLAVELEGVACILPSCLEVVGLE